MPFNLYLVLLVDFVLFIIFISSVFAFQEMNKSFWHRRRKNIFLIRIQYYNKVPETKMIYAIFRREQISPWSLFLPWLSINSCLFLNQSETSNFLKTVLLLYVFKDIFFNETKMKKKCTSNIQLKQPLFLANDEVAISKIQRK